MKRIREDDDEDAQDIDHSMSRKVRSVEIISSQGGRESDEEDDEDDEFDEDDFEDELDEEDIEDGIASSAARPVMSGRKGLFLSRQPVKAREDDFKVTKKTTDATTAPTAPPPNRQRVMMLSSRGIIYRHRHLMMDLHSLMPHAKKESKLDSKSKLYVLNELSELANCNNCVYFESRKHQDLYMWMAKTPNGPSVKFLVQNIQTMDELKLTGNSLKGSRPILSFDKAMDCKPEYVLIKELLTQIFGTPRTSRKTKPFFDHVMSFSLLDGRIWFRNFQIIEKVDDKEKDPSAKMTLTEIGPRFCLSLIKIFDGGFSGSGLYESPTFESPNTARRLAKLEKQSAYVNRVSDNVKKVVRMANSAIDEDPLDEVFYDHEGASDGDN
ncbi:hypothetical protein SmJEL517_g05511 [Synchytrium microbalum]|uniref:Brix domain-containing protein n=1 Tax=Synchytrium microbalum TaxID=1806994 RepID=A0A507BNL0_9FUNG|nr:uncharacterized protein SmJEL517_g05511 [Synchytrium microbalum]TPX31057.1 hypothetical protein SmJEL517_g05511 [Synchytrium microbalum]